LDGRIKNPGRDSEYFRMDVFWYGGAPPADVSDIRRIESLEGLPTGSLLFIDSESIIPWESIGAQRAYLVADLPVSTPPPEQVVGVIPRDAMVVRAIVSLYNEMRESHDLGDELIRSLNEKELAIREKQKIMLRDSRRYKAIIKNATDLIFILGPTGRIMFCNETVKRYLAGPGRPVTGSALVDYVLDEDRASVEEMLNRGFQAGVPARAEVRITLAGGKTGIFSCMSTPLEEDGHIYALSVIGRDITDLRAIERRLSLQAKDLALMINGLAHELRNPLTIIGAYTNRLGRNDNALNRGRLDAALSGIQSSISRIEEMIRRIEQYEAVVNKEVVHARVDLRSLVEEALSAFSPLPDVTVQGPESLKVCTDAGHVRAALVRILENAMETGSERLLVSLSSRGGYARVSLRDYGPGVSDDVETIFAPFFSTDPMKIGLGLTEARIAMAKIGSRIDVLPQAAPGAVFTLEILADRRSGPRGTSPVHP
jgi:PAS domain S-box-containing protein